MRLKHYLWVGENIWGWVFGWSLFAPLNRIFLNLSLHALGLDNPRFSGEKWFIEKILKKGDIQISIDIGANVGHYASDLIKNLNSTVYAIEPLSSSYKALSEQAKEFEGKLIPIHTALADHIGTSTIYTKGPSSEKATLSKEGERFGMSEEITVTTLDAVVKEKSIDRIDFIKIDTEGFEREVLRGMQATLAQLKPKYIQFEFNINQLERGYTVHDLSTLLPGYTLRRLLPHGWIAINPHSFASNIFMFQNIIAIRN